MALDENLLNRIRDVVLGFRKPEKIILFGSRGRGEGGARSDVDIAIVAPGWTDRDFNLLRDRLEEEVKTPLKFDVVDLARLEKQNLKETILKEGRVIYEGGQKPPASR